MMLTAFFGVMLLFVLGNAAILYSLLSRYENSLGQVAIVDNMRMTSQHLAVLGMRLSDGAYVQTAQLGQAMASMDRSLLALEKGGVNSGREVAALKLPEVQPYLVQIQQDWRNMHRQLQFILLGSYTQESGLLKNQLGSRAIQRQWVADEARALLATLDAMRQELVPLLHQSKDRAQMLLGGLLLFDLVFLLGLFIALRQWVLLPLRELHAAGLDLVRGRYDVRIQRRGVAELNSLIRLYTIGALRLKRFMASVAREREKRGRSDIIFQGLAGNSLVGIFLLKPDGFSFVSDKMAEIFGYTAEEMVTDMDLMSVIAPRERHLVAEAIKSSKMRKNHTLRFERHGRCKNGSLIDIEVFGTSITVGHQEAIIGLVQDITERKRAESSAQLAAIAYDNSSEAIVITDAAGVVIDVNPAYVRMSGYWSDELTGEVLPLLRPGRHNRDFYDEMWHSINTTGRWEGEYWARRKDGEQYAERVIIDTAWNHDGSVNCRVAMLSDITIKKQVENRIWHQAHHDALTGLPNRQYFNEHLQSAVLQAHENGKQLGLLFLDLDLFKEVNDSMGHTIGDRLLIQVGQRLRACVPADSCFVARLGGDEFIVLISDAPENKRLDRLCQLLLDQITQPYLLGGESVRVSASLGVALYPRDAEDAESLISHVDMAMYEAKNAGRNCFRYFDATMRMRAGIQRDLLYSLGHAIESGQFFLLYQPVISFADQRIERVEALLRWRHPEFGVISPLEFLPYAEDRHLIRPLGDWIFAEALQQLKHWRKTAPWLRLSLSVSPAQVSYSPSDVHNLLTEISYAGLAKDSLTLEFSDRAFGRMDSRAYDGLVRLSQSGIRFSVGMAVMGVSAMLSMRRELFDTLVLEREIVEQLSRDSDVLLVCDCIVSLAHRLDLQVVAKGISTREQFEILQELGCNAGQGYWFDRPLEAKALAQRLASEPER